MKITSFCKKDFARNGILLLFLISLFFPFFAQAQKVGVNTTTPSTSLEVEGTTTTDTLVVTAGAVNGYILKTDGNGNASWTNASGTGALRHVGTSYLGQTSGAGSTGTSEGTSSNLYNIGIGANALNANTTGNNNIAFGQNALNANTSNSNNIAIGQNALQLVSDYAYYYQYPEIAIGYNALKSNNYAAGNIAIGYQSQQSTNGDGNSTGVGNISLGVFSLKNNTEGNSNVAIGGSSLQYNTTGVTNTGIGANALQNNTTGYNNTAIGFNTGITNVANSTVANTTGNHNTFLGAYTGAGSNNLNNATAIGFYAMVNSSNSLVLGGTGAYAVNVGIGTTIPSETLDVVGKTKTTNFQMTNGATNGYVLQSDASGNGSWVNATTLSTATPTKIQDADANTRVETENSSNEDVIRHFLNGTEYFTFMKGRLAFPNNTNNIFIGNDAGITTGNSFLGKNVAIGSNALKSINANTNGNVALGYSAMEKLTGTYANNTAIGTNALQFLTSGGGNVALGFQAGQNATGLANVFIGRNAGANETGSNKLYIDNTDTSSPLILGDFSTKKLTINDSLVSKYLQMTNGATSGYILQSDASGNASWVNPTSLNNGNWTTSSTNQYSALSGNVGIGTSSPTSKLDIQSSSSVTANVQSSGSSAYVTAAAPAGSETGFNFKTYSGGSGLNRWLFGKSIGAESGSNAGSDFFINRYSDAGSYTGQPFAITRSTGTVTVGYDQVDASANTLKLNGSMAVKVSAITTSGNTTTLDGDDYMLVYSGSTSGNSVTLPTASSYAGRLYMVVNHSSSTVSISTYYFANATTSTSVVAGTTLQLVSDGSNWHKIN